MKKILFLLSLFLTLWGCEKDFDSTVDTQNYSYQVVSLSSFPSFRYTVGDSTITVFLTINSSSDISKVFFDIYASDGSKLNAEEIQLLDNGNSVNGDQTAGDNRYTNKFALSRNNPIGLYTIRFFVTDQGNTTKQVAIQNFTYDNGQSNIAPVISNALIEPDTVVVTGIVQIQNSIEVFDANGLNDIENIYFIVYRPDGSTNGIQNLLYDDGSCCPIPPLNQLSGDGVAGDGTFSLRVQVDQNNMKGTYNFQFQARDRGGLLSNIIDYPVLIQ